MWKKSFILTTLVVLVAGQRKQNGLANKQGARPFYDPVYCENDPDLVFFGDDLDCTVYWECDEFGDVIERFCPDGEIFDTVELFCGESNELRREKKCSYTSNFCRTTRRGDLRL
jgi:Chitin binding Peritrophin-A domain